MIGFRPPKPACPGLLAQVPTPEPRSVQVLALSIAAEVARGYRSESIEAWLVEPKCYCSQS